MNEQFDLCWSGDVHGPDRGLLCALEARFPIQAAPPLVLYSDRPPRVRKPREHRDRLDLTNVGTVRVRELLTSGAHTVVQLEARLALSRSTIDQALRALRHHGLLSDRDLPDLTFGRPRKVYWIA